MSDEEELRARIEAQIAARRAEAAPPKRERTTGRRGKRDNAEPSSDRSPEHDRDLASTEHVAADATRSQSPGERHDDDTAHAEHDSAETRPEHSERGPRTLHPDRPWQSRRGEDEQADTERERTSREGRAGPPRLGSISPDRPWERRTAHRPGTEEPLRGRGSQSDTEQHPGSGSLGSMRPTRPWASVPDEDAAVAPAPRSDRDEPFAAPTTSAAHLDRPEPRLAPEELPPVDDLGVEHESWMQRRRHRKAQREEERAAEQARHDAEEHADRVRTAEQQRREQAEREAQERHYADASRIAGERRQADATRLAEQVRIEEAARRAEIERRELDERTAEQIRRDEAQRRVEAEEQAERDRLAEEVGREEEQRRAQAEERAGEQRARAAQELARAQAARHAEDERRAEQERRAQTQRAEQAALEADAHKQADARRHEDEQRAREEEHLSRRERRRLRQTPEQADVPEEVPQPASESLDVAVVLDEVAAYRAELDRLRQQIAALADEFADVAPPARPTDDSDAPTSEQPDEPDADEIAVVEAAQPAATVEVAEPEPAQREDETEHEDESPIPTPSDAATAKADSEPQPPQPETRRRDSGFEPARIWRSASADFGPPGGPDLRNPPEADTDLEEPTDRPESGPDAVVQGARDPDTTAPETTSETAEADTAPDPEAPHTVAPGTDLPRRLAEAGGRPPSEDFDRGRDAEPHYDEPPPERTSLRRAFRRMLQPGSESGSGSGTEEGDRGGQPPPLSIDPDLSPTERDEDTGTADVERHTEPTGFTTQIAATPDPWNVVGDIRHRSPWQPGRGDGEDEERSVVDDAGLEQSSPAGQREILATQDDAEASDEASPDRPAQPGASSAELPADELDTPPPAYAPGADLARRLAAAGALPPPDEDALADEDRDTHQPHPRNPLRRAFGWLFQPADDEATPERDDAHEQDTPAADQVQNVISTPVILPPRPLHFPVGAQRGRERTSEPQSPETDVPAAASAASELAGGALPDGGLDTAAGIADAPDPIADGADGALGDEPAESATHLHDHALPDADTDALPDADTDADTMLEPSAEVEPEPEAEPEVEPFAGLHVVDSEPNGAAAKQADVAPPGIERVRRYATLWNTAEPPAAPPAEPTVELPDSSSDDEPVPIAPAAALTALSVSDLTETTVDDNMADDEMADDDMADGATGDDGTGDDGTGDDGTGEPEAFPTAGDGRRSPGSDLARRLAAANAGALARAQLGTSVTDTPVEQGQAREGAAQRAATRVLERPSRVSVAERGGGGSAFRTLRSNGWVRLLFSVVVVVVIAVLLRTYVVSPYYIPSASMETTLHGCSGCDNDHVLVDKLSYHLHPIHRGDVVVFHRPTTWSVSDAVLIKRVIGLPGDVLTDQNGTVYVNGLQLVEPYVNPLCPNGTEDLRRTVVPAGDLFVMGDNRCDSADSRTFGPVPESDVIGRAFLIVWPLGRIHWL